MSDNLTQIIKNSPHIFFVLKKFRCKLIFLQFCSSKIIVTRQELKHERITLSEHVLKKGWLNTILKEEDLDCQVRISKKMKSCGLLMIILRKK